MDKSYRKVIYDTYVTEKVKKSTGEYTLGDYKQAAAATRKRLSGWLPSSKQANILDMGCGHGNILYLFKELGYTNLTGVDISPEQIAYAEKFVPEGKFILGDLIATLEQYENTFDLITGFDIVEHFDRNEILNIMSKVSAALKPGGTLILQLPNAESPWWGTVGYGDFTHEWFYVPNSLDDLLRKFGFEQFEAREPYIHVHGIKSFARLLTWKVIKLFLKVWNIAETGHIGSGVYTRVMLAKCIKKS